jgi:DNA-binding MurR/RpiR family transcriptional regulator
MAKKSDTAKSVVSRISGAQDSLKKAERRVAEYVLSDPSSIVHSSIMEVAEKSGVADATVVRFCRTFGMKGFQDLKIRLARELVSEKERVIEDLKEGDSPDVVLEKVFKASIQSLNDTMDVIDKSGIKKAVTLLKKAKRIFFIGVGTSGPNVIDAFNKFSRLGLNCLYHTDSHLQVMTAALLEKGDVVIAVSHSGSTKDPIETVEAAKKNGAKVICITNNSLSPLTKISDIKLFTASRETKFRSEAMASRIAQTGILNALYMAVALSDMKKTITYNKKIEDAIVQKQY